MERFSRAWDNKNACIVHVRELPKSRNGAKCDCVCVECNGALEALQGDKNDWSFRHQSTTNCKGGPMTALHMLSQQLLCGDRTIKLAGGEVSYLDGRKEWPIPESRFRADVAGTKADGFPYVVEIFVTHRLKEEEEKVKFIRERKLHSIEINLSAVDREISNEDLLRLLLTDVDRQTVIYAPPLNQNGTIQLPDQTKGQWYDDIIPAAIIIGFCLAIYKWVIRPMFRKRK